MSKLLLRNGKERSALTEPILFNILFKFCCCNHLEIRGLQPGKVPGEDEAGGAMLMRTVGGHYVNATEVNVVYLSQTSFTFRGGNKEFYDHLI